MLLSASIVLVALLLFGLFSAFQQATLTREQLADKVQISASHLQSHPAVVSALEADETTDELIQLAEAIREENEFLYIVVMDTDQKRYTHPVEDRIGERFVGGDADLVFEGESYISEAVGFLGPSVRAFEPVYSQTGELIGAVSVGISTDAINEAENQAILTSVAGASGSLLVGMIGAYFLSNRIKKQLHGLEPQQIARLVNEREAILEAAGEGVIAINEDSEIIAINGAATTFLKATNHEDSVEGKKVHEVWPELKLEEVMEQREGSYDVVYQRSDLEAVVTKVPIFFIKISVSVRLPHFVKRIS